MRLFLFYEFKAYFGIGKMQSVYAK